MTPLLALLAFEEPDVTGQHHTVDVTRLAAFGNDADARIAFKETDLGQTFDAHLRKLLLVVHEPH
ncbi:MAG: hypothetical protein OEV40_15680 [Acidimicrobiia bacterium]|nr:hypothetical protein [Acidimicrobiia bacterium]